MNEETIGREHMPAIGIAHGATRVVILTRRYAIKFPSLKYSWRNFLWGLLGNIQEREWARTKHPKLCPVIFSIPGGFLVVMRRALPLAQNEYAAFNYWDFVMDDDLYIPVENKRDSFGILDGRIVAIDYGSAGDSLPSNETCAKAVN